MFVADRMHAVVIFSSDADYALRVARIAHLYCDTKIPHLIFVTPSYQLNKETVDELRRLGARLLMDCDSSIGSLTVSHAQHMSGAVPDMQRDIHPAARDLAATLSSFDFPRPLSFIDASMYPYQTAGAGSAVAWSDWIGLNLPYRPRVQNIILFVRPDWMNCGSGTTFESLARWFRENDGLLIDIGIWPYADPFDLTEGQEQIKEEQHHIGAALYFSTRRSTNILYFVRQLGLLFQFLPTTVSNQFLLFNAMAAKPRLLRRAVARARITHIYLNHYFTYAYAKELIRGRKFFLDTHDIQSINFVHNASPNYFTRHSDTFDRLLADEMRIADRAERLSFVSMSELELAAAHIAREKLSYLIALPSVTPCPPKPLATPARLLIVASNNRANVRNLSWFLYQVWPMILEHFKTLGNGIPLVEICGGIAAEFAPDVAENVTFTGVVEALSPHYDSCDLVLLPVVTGGGIAIKTIEALLHARAVVATGHALRGLPCQIADTIGFADDAAMFARSVIRLLLSAQAHRRQVERSRIAAQLLKDQKFYERLSASLDAVRLDGG